MKKVIFTVLCVCLIAFSAGCSKNSEEIKASKDALAENAKNSGFSIDGTEKKDKNDNYFIGAENAERIALDNAGYTKNDVVIRKTIFDHDDGKQVYEIEFNDGTGDYDYKIDAVSGEIVGKAFEANESVAADTTITVDEAKMTALSRVEGALPDNIYIETDTEDGKAVYEGKIIHEKTEYEFVIDAQTGDIIEWETEQIF